MSKYHNDLLARYYDIGKTQELIAKYYYWLILSANVESYNRGYNICLASKWIGHKSYDAL